jgi:hypothetical protein
MKRTTTVAGLSIDGSFNENIVRAGINFKFGPW